MKFLTLVMALSFSLIASASNDQLQCDLFANDTLIRSSVVSIDAEGEASVDLGQEEECSFGGFAWDGYPGTMIMCFEGASKMYSEKTEEDSVTLASGKVMKIRYTVF